MFIVDEAIAITGGRNMADEYFDYDSEYNFKDREVLFDSKFQSYANFWDFTVDSRQEYIFSVSIPKEHNESSQDERNKKKPEILNKCVILLIGFVDNVEM